MELLLDPGMKPFAFFAALVVGFLILELLFMMIGVDTRLGGDVDIDMDLDIDADFDVDTDFDADLDIDAEAGLAADTDGALSGVEASGGFLDLIGIRKLPMTVWLALFSAFFAGLGMAGQTLIHTLFSGMAPAMVASLAVLPVALFLTGIFSEAVSNWIPREETSAISERSYGRRQGVVTVGTARRGVPAQVRFTDGHGNLHYVMAEPMSDDEEIPQGAEVFILRKRDGQLRLVRTL